MKKWHLEGVLHPIAPEKLVLPNLGQSVVFHSPSFLEIRKESKIVFCCRQVAAFLIRFF